MVLQIGILLINNTGGLKDILALIWNDETVCIHYLKKFVYFQIDYLFVIHFVGY